MPNQLSMIAGAKKLAATLEKSRKKRDEAVNNSRTRKEEPAGSHRPNPRRSRKDILDELT